MAIVPTIRLDVSEVVAVSLDRIKDDTRVVVTDHKSGGGLVGSFMTGGLTHGKIEQNVKYLKDAAFRHRCQLGLS